VSESNPPETERPDPTPERSATATSTPQATVGKLGDPQVQNYKLHVPLQAGEQVIMVRKKHWMFLVPNTLLNFILALIPVILLVKFLDLVGVSGGKPATIIYLVWFLIFIFCSAIDWYRYYNDTWVITDQRVIDTRRKSPFDLQVSTADLVNIQEMTVRRKGIFQTMLDYGDVVCETAGSDHNDFTITGVPNPREVQALVDKERDRERTRGRTLLS